MDNALEKSCFSEKMYCFFPVFAKLDSIVYTSPEPCGKTRCFDGHIFISLELFNPLCLKALPGRNRIFVIPGIHELALLPTHAIFGVDLIHVFIGSRDGSPGRNWRFDLPVLDFHFADRPKGWFFHPGQKLEIVILPHGVYRADSRHEIIHVRLHPPELGVCLFRAAAAFERLTPADALWIPLAPLPESSSEILGGNNMFPFNPAGSPGMFCDCEPLGKPYPFPLVKAR